MTNAFRTSWRKVSVKCTKCLRAKTSIEACHWQPPCQYGQLIYGSLRTGSSLCSCFIKNVRYMENKVCLFCIRKSFHQMLQTSCGYSVRKWLSLLFWIKGESVWPFTVIKRWKINNIEQRLQPTVSVAKAPLVSTEAWLDNNTAVRWKPCHSYLFWTTLVSIIINIRVMGQAFASYFCRARHHWGALSGAPEHLPRLHI